MANLDNSTGAPLTKTLCKQIPPPNPDYWPCKVRLGSPEYMRLVARDLPQGTPAKAEAILRNSELPVILPEPMTGEKLLVEILESHERGWVGINQLALFE